MATYAIPPRCHVKEARLQAQTNRKDRDLALSGGTRISTSKIRLDVDNGTGSRTMTCMTRAEQFLSSHT